MYKIWGATDDFNGPYKFWPFYVKKKRVQLIQLRLKAHSAECKSRDLVI